MYISHTKIPTLGYDLENTENKTKDFLLFYKMYQL
jgi:hypothetical protein